MKFGETILFKTKYISTEDIKRGKTIACRIIISLTLLDNDEIKKIKEIDMKITAVIWKCQGFSLISRSCENVVKEKKGRDPIIK